MGEQVSVTAFSRDDRQRYREKVKRCLDVFARMLRESQFDPGRRSVGLEIELNLTDEAGDPAMVNARALELIANPDFQTELGQFNVEINIPPHTLRGAMFAELERDVRASLNDAEDRASEAGAHMMLIGILPTLSQAHLSAESFSDNPRYRLLSEQIFAARGEDLEIAIAGIERLATYADTIAPEAACTSVQLHQQVDPVAFAAHWNAAQAIAGVQLAVAANSPFFFGKELWRETRIASSSRPPTRAPRSSRRRACGRACGLASAGSPRSSISSRRTCATSPRCCRSARTRIRSEALERGDVPRLSELRLHNGTVYRWNRPVYDVVRGRPHLRREQGAARRADGGRHPRQRRVLLRAGGGVRGRRAPDLVPDVLLRRRGELSRLCTRGHRGSRVLARRGGGARSRARAAPAAAAGSAGLERYDIDVSDRDRLLGIIERRCVNGQNGASWQSATFHHLYGDRRMDRGDALREMTVRYREHMHSNEPVHSWPLP